MALNIKNAEVERLAAEVATLAKESKTEAIRLALLERKARLRARGLVKSKLERLEAYLERNVWSTIPADKLGKKLTREEEDHILGYGPEGF